MTDGDVMHNEDNVFSYQLSPGADVEAGDVIGVEQLEDSQLFLVFLHSDDVINYVTDLDHDSTEFDVKDSEIVMRLPLLSPEFLPSSEPTPPDTPPSLSLPSRYIQLNNIVMRPPLLRLEFLPSSEPTPPTDTLPSQAQPSR